MRRRSRLLRVAKWGGVVVCGLFLLLCLASAKWLIEYRWASGTSMYGVFICRGAIGVHADVQPEIYWSGEWAIQDGYHRPKLLREIAANPWRIERLDPGLPQIHWPAVWYGCRGSVSCPSGIDRLVPFWMPFVATLIPTAFFWWRDRSPKPGHCRCGYNLTGLPEPRCPECGQPFEPKGDAP